jgi:hypothetical protein
LCGILPILKGLGFSKAIEEIKTMLGEMGKTPFQPLLEEQEDNDENSKTSWKGKQVL